MNNDLDILTDWFKSNKLSLNAGKTYCMLFYHDKKFERNTHDERDILKLNGLTISEVKQTKFLGMIMDERLEWKEHIELCKSKLNSGIYVLNKVKNILSISLLTTIYYSMIHPYISYGILLWGSAYMKHIKGMEILQKRAIRHIYQVNSRTSTLPLFLAREILKVQDIFKLQLTIFMYKYYNLQLPEQLLNIFTRNTDVHTHNTRHNRGPHTISRRSNVMSRSFLCKGPDLWNNLPANLKEATSINAFKRQSKTIYLHHYDT